MRVVVTGGFHSKHTEIVDAVRAVMDRLHAAHPITFLANSGEGHGACANYAMRWAMQPAHKGAIQTKAFGRGAKKQSAATLMLHNAHVLKAVDPDVVVGFTSMQRDQGEEHMLKLADDQERCLVLVETVERWRVRRWPYGPPSAAPAPEPVERARRLMAVLDGAVDKELDVQAERAKKAITTLGDVVVVRGAHG